MFDLKIKYLYVFLCIIGAILPYYFFLPFLIENGINFHILIDLLFVNKVSSAFGINALITSIIFVIFISIENNKIKLPHLWIPILASSIVGVSFGLPLYLLIKELKK
jgi:hypothetical protein